MPAYNAGRFISDAIQSVLEQTYADWELLVCDDCSTDDTATIVKSAAKQDSRIHYLSTNHPSGSPSEPRNRCIEAAQGRYIAFLDSDDMWCPTRLEHQLPLLQEDDVALAFSDYIKMDENGNLHHSVITAPKIVDYRRLLQSNYLGCLTVLLDTKKVGKHYFKRTGHEDYILWLQLLKQGYKAINTQTIEAYYRVSKLSVSSNKFKALSWQWNILRNEEHINLLPSMYYFVYYACNAFIKSRR